MDPALPSLILLYDLIVILEQEFFVRLKFVHQTCHVVFIVDILLALVLSKLHETLNLSFSERNTLCRQKFLQQIFSDIAVFFRI